MQLAIKQWQLNKMSMRKCQVGTRHLGILPGSSIEGLCSRRMSGICTPSCSSAQSWQRWLLQDKQEGHFLVFLCLYLGTWSVPWPLLLWNGLLNTHCRRNRWPGRALSLTGQRHSTRRRWQTLGKRRGVVSKVNFSLRLDKQRCHDNTAISLYLSDLC